MPLFTLIIISQGPDERLIKCLDSLRVPEANWQLILHVHGKKLSDAVKAKAEALTSSVLMIESPEHLTYGRARNLALDQAEGEWVCFLHEDANLLKDYWDILLPLVKEPKIDVIGGVDIMASNMSALSRAVSISLTSPFCAGTTFARHKALGKKMQEADEEKLSQTHLWVRRSVIGNYHFPETYKRGDEVLFLQLLKSKGAGMFYHPKLKVAFFRSSRFTEIFRSTFYAGYYRSKLMRQKLSPGSSIFWLPAMFVLLHLLFFLDTTAFVSLVRLYVGIIFFVSFGLAIKAHSTWLFPIIAILHYVIVLIFGVGFLTERIFRDKN